MINLIQQERLSQVVSLIVLKLKSNPKVDVTAHLNLRQRNNLSSNSSPDFNQGKIHARKAMQVKY